MPLEINTYDHCRSRAPIYQIEDVENYTIEQHTSNHMQHDNSTNDKHKIGSL